jgi:hypothetical protein
VSSILDREVADGHLDAILKDAEVGGRQPLHGASIAIADEDIDVDHRQLDHDPGAETAS